MMEQHLVGVVMDAGELRALAALVPETSPLMAKIEMARIQLEAQPQSRYLML